MLESDPEAPSESLLFGDVWLAWPAAMASGMEEVWTRPSRAAARSAAI